MSPRDTKAVAASALPCATPLRLVDRHTRPGRGSIAFCGACRIREECLSWALKNGERYGVWGGLTEQQRRRLQRAAVA